MSSLHSLSVFRTVVEEGSFSAAAKKLHLTQPTISFHIDNLEEEFNCKLVIRTTKGIGLTIYGQKLYRGTQTIHTIVEEISQQIKALVAGNAGEIFVGASTIPGEYILPRLLSEFLQKHPNVRISLSISNSQTILEAYKNNQYPIAVIGINPGPDVPHFPLWQDELILIAHPDFANKVFMTQITDLLEVPFILRQAPSGTRETLLNALTQTGLDIGRLKVVLEVNGNEALKLAVLNKAGIGFISRWAVQYELATGKLCNISLPQIRITRTFYGLHNHSLMPTAVQLFWDYVQKKQISLN